MKRILLLVFLATLAAILVSHLNLSKPGVDLSILPSRSETKAEPGAKSQGALKSLRHVAIGNLSLEERARILRVLDDDKRQKDAWYDRATLFEANLSKSDIAKITKNHPDSFFRYAGFFTTQSSLRGKCTKAEYQNLKRKIPLETIHERAGAIVVLAQLYDERHLLEYISRIRSFWLVDAHWSEFRDLDDYYAYVSLLHEQTKRTDSELEERQSKYEGILAQAGVSKEGVENYVLHMAALSPPCLGQIHMDFFRWIRSDITWTRGQFILGRLRRYWARKHELPSNFSELVPTPGDPIRDRLRDGWGNEFKVKEENAREFLLYSIGDDGEPDNDDDVRVGTFDK